MTLPKPSFFWMLDALNDRERRVISCRFGLCGKKPLTLKETGLEIGNCAGRVYQLERKAFRELRRGWHQLCFAKKHYGME